MSNSPELHDATKIPRPESQAVRNLLLTGKDANTVSTKSFLAIPNEGQLLFLQGRIAAAICGNVVYIPDHINPASVTRHLNQLHQPLVRLAPQDFDFTVGSMLTKIGLALTTRTL